jgi:hypothetical protein
VIDWAQGKISIQNINLSIVMRYVGLTYQSFEWLYFHHILRELNSKANELSKEALQLQRGAFKYYEYSDGSEIEALEFHM